MPATGPARQVSIYVREDTRIHGKPVYMAVLELLRAKGAGGATVVRGVAGFDGGSQIHSAGVVALSADLPVKVEWVDSPERIDALLPEVKQIVSKGLITVQDVTVVKWAAPIEADILERPVTSIMSAAVAVETGTSLGDVVTLLLREGYRSVPVVDGERRVVGIVTQGDLLRNTTLPVRLGLQAALTQDQVQSDITDLHSEGRTVGEIMTMPVVTILDTKSVRQAGTAMVEHDLKRLPVVDHGDFLVGIVSRVDILHALSATASRPESTERVSYARAEQSISGLMNSAAPSVTASATLEEVMQALERSRQQRLVVIDDARKVVGVITDGDLLRRSMYGRSPSLRQRLRGLITGTQVESLVLPTGTECAADLMTSPVISVDVDASLSEALGLMLAHALKRLPVIDGDGKLVGVLGRSSVLRGLMPEEPSGDE